MDAGVGIFCNACRLQIETQEERNTHYKSDFHRYNIKRKCAGLEPISSKVFHSKLAVFQESQKAPSQGSEYKCAVCNNKFHTLALYEQHTQSRKHKLNMKNNTTAAAGPVVIPPPANKLKKEEEERKKREEEQAKLRQKKREDQEVHHSDSDWDIENESEEEKKSGEESAEEEEEEGARVFIPLGSCLFCSKECGSMEASVDHMAKAHSFFIPWLPYLVDMEGLLEYLGHKVGVGHVCLHCNGKGGTVFKTTRACQQHMVDKAHCRVSHIAQEEEEDMAEFFDFEQEIDDEEQGEGEENNERRVLDVSKLQIDRRPVDVSAAGELVLSDGAKLGVRQLARYYKQKPRPGPSQALIIRSVIENYKSIAPAQKFPELTWTHKRIRDKFAMSVGLHNNFQHHFRRQYNF